MGCGASQFEHSIQGGHCHDCATNFPGSITCSVNGPITCQTGTVKMNYAVSDDYRPNKHKGYRVCAPDCYGGFMDKGECWNCADRFPGSRICSPTEPLDCKNRTDVVVDYTCTFEDYWIYNKCPFRGYGDPGKATAVKRMCMSADNCPSDHWLRKPLRSYANLEPVYHPGDPLWCTACPFGSTACDRETGAALACKAGLLLYKDACHSKCPDYLTPEGICAAECPLSSFSSFANAKGERTCERCSDPLAESCDRLYSRTCKPGARLLSARCYSTCPDRSFPSEDGKSCTSCGQWTQNCTSAADLTCIKGAALHQGQCVQHCPDGLYSDETNCVSCNVVNARTCDGDRALSCKSGTFLSSGKCLSACPTGTFASVGRCLSSCPDNQFLLAGQCVSKCSENYFVDMTGKQCQRCAFNTYRTCSSAEFGAATSCIDSFWLSRGECLQQCPTGGGGQSITYPDPTTRACVRCPDRSSRCDATGALSCSTYRANGLNIPYKLSNGTCVKDCGPRTFSIDAKSCGRCPVNALTCSSSTVALTCAPGTTLVRNTCVSTCGTGTYLSPTGCLPCAERAATCSAEGILTCVSNMKLVAGACVPDCDVGLSFYPGANRCVSNCTEATYGSTYSVNGVCTKCKDASARTCNSSGDSLTCSTGSKVYKGKCVPASCPLYTYYTDTECIACPNGQFSDRCDASGSLQCIKGYKLHNKSCIRDCPSSFFAVGSFFDRCASCPAGALTCTDATTALTCTPETRLNDGACVSQCPPERETTATACVPRIEQAVTCSTGQKLVDGKCITECEERSFVAGPGLCVPCSEFALSCSDEKTALTCTPETRLYSGSCLSSCPTGTTASDKTCEPTPVCSIGQQSVDGKCAAIICPERTFLDGSRCEKCPTAALACSNEVTATRCEPGTMLYKGMCIKSDSCRARTFAFRGECISTCPTGLYRSDLTCLPCSNIDAKAVSCNSTSALSCTGRYKLALGKCVLRCPSGTYPAGANCPSCPVANSSCTSATSFTCLTGFTLTNEACVKSTRSRLLF